MSRQQTKLVYEANYIYVMHEEDIDFPPNKWLDRQRGQPSDVYKSSNGDFKIIFWLPSHHHNLQAVSEVRRCGLTSAASLNLISYMRMSPLGWGGSGQRRNTQSSWPSQVKGPGMSSAFSGKPQGNWLPRLPNSEVTWWLNNNNNKTNKKNHRWPSDRRKTWVMLPL